MLIVDDDESAREILKEQLKFFHIEAVTVNSGEAAFQELKNQTAERPYDLVLMDWMMPGMDGIETANEIIHNNDFHSIPVIIMVTGFGREEVMEKAENVSAM